MLINRKVSINKKVAINFSTKVSSIVKSITIKIGSSEEKGNVYIRSTNRNIFCTLMDLKDKKVKTSCSLKVPDYINEFNERENIFKRGILLGELLGNRIIDLGYKEVALYLDFSINKGRKGVVIGLKKKIKISLIQLSKGYSHNGCRPKKIRRKKVRTKFKS